MGVVGLSEVLTGGGFLIACVCFVVLPVFSEGTLVGAAVLPHGDFAFDPEILRDWNADDFWKAEALHSGSSEASSFIADSKPDVIILSTPHGVALSETIAVYGDAQLAGPALLGRDVNASFGDGTAGAGRWIQFEAAGDEDFAGRVASVLGNNATLLKAWGGALPMALRWGEVLPLRLISRGEKLTPRLVVLSLPMTRYTHSGALTDGFRRLGRQLGAFLDDVPARVAVVVSTDLAHTHWPNSTFGFESGAVPFEEACGRWAEHLDWEELGGLRGAVDSVLSCGYLGLPLLHGVMEATNATTDGPWMGSVTAVPSAPTYYGMMAATFKRQPPVQV